MVSWESRTAGHGVTWNNEHPTEANGALWPRPYVLRNTNSIKYGHLGQGDCPFGQVTFHYHLPSGKEIRKIIC